MAGTTTITFLPGPKRRRYDSDDTFDRVLQWLRVCAANPGAALADVDLVHPRRALAAGDDRKTLQGLGLWPSATVRVKNPNAPPPPPPTDKRSVRANKPKPSDLFRAVNNRFAKAGA